MEHLFSLIAGSVGGILSIVGKYYFDKKHERNSITNKEKIALYKEISEPIIGLIIEIQQQNLTHDILISFEKKRLFITAQLAMFAPQNVFDDYNAMIDYLYYSLEKDQYSFIEFRKYAMKFLSSIRKDIGIYTDEILYNGNR